MRMSGVDIMVVVFMGVALALMVPIPWLLTASWERSARQGDIHCTPSPSRDLSTLTTGPMPLAALWLTSGSAMSQQDCHPTFSESLRR